MDGNQLERNLKVPMKDLLKFLGDQGTNQAEFTIAKIALEYRLQKKRIRPTWILAWAIIGALLITIIQMVRLENRVNDVEQQFQQKISDSIISNELSISVLY